MDLSRTARLAAAAAATWLRSVPPPPAEAWEAKSPRDWVTDVDRRAEALVREVLAAETPGARVVGEELGPELAREGLVWIVDPLDGTTNFLHGFPAYAVSVAAAVDGELVAGVVHEVPHDRVYHAAAGHGAWCGDRRLEVSRLSDPAGALIGTGFPFRDLSRADEYLAQFRRVMAGTSGLRRPGSAALDLASVAAGAFDGFWELMLAPWDIAAGIVLVREAGGVVTDLAGREIGAEHTGVVAGNPAMHRWLLEAVGGQR